MNSESIIAIRADPDDPEDFDVGVDGLRDALDRRAQRGRSIGSGKVQVTIRLDKDVLDRFRASGPGWQTRINEALRKAVG